MEAPNLLRVRAQSPELIVNKSQTPIWFACEVVVLGVPTLQLPPKSSICGFS